MQKSRHVKTQILRIRQVKSPTAPVQKMDARTVAQDNIQIYRKIIQITIKESIHIGGACNWFIL